MMPFGADASLECLFYRDRIAVTFSLGSATQWPILCTLVLMRYKLLLDAGMNGSHQFQNCTATI